MTSERDTSPLPRPDEAGSGDDDVDLLALARQGTSLNDSSPLKSLGTVLGALDGDAGARTGLQRVCRDLFGKELLSFVKGKPF